MSSPLLKAALLGRPNVGKSTLFNRLIRSNRAITHDRAGITRDRMEGTVRAHGYDPFIIIDTGGVTLDSHAHVTEGPAGIRGFESAILAQAKDAVQESNLLCLVVNARDGLTPLDKHLADFLRKTGKPLIIVANKVDGPEKADLLMAEFHTLGLDILPCSAAHGYNVRELEDEIRTRLFDIPTATEGDPDALPEGLNLDGATRRQRKRLHADFRARAASAKDEAALAQASALDDELAQAADADDAYPDDAYLDNALARDENEDEAIDPALLDDSDISSAEYEALFEAELAQAERDLAIKNKGIALCEDVETAILAPEDDDTGGEPACDDSLTPDATMADPHTGPLRLALLGRPNAGKSSLVNVMAGVTRMIVSDVAGTTRDSVDVAIEIDGEPCVFVDTAGVRRRARISDTVERYSVNSSIKSTTKAHVTLLLLDAKDGITLQDKRLIDLLNERKTPFVVLVNKWDLIEARDRKEAEKNFKEILVFCQHVPVLFISTLKHRNLAKIVPLARAVRHECGVRIPTGQLNRAMEAVLGRHQPPIVKGVRAKFFYLTQAETAPPTFVFFVNNADRVLASYARYLERSLRKLFSITHAPMRVHFRSSHKKRGR